MVVNEYFLDIGNVIKKFQEKIANCEEIHNQQINQANQLKLELIEGR